jgi:hypothetical protein
LQIQALGSSSVVEVHINRLKNLTQKLFAGQLGVLQILTKLLHKNTGNVYGLKFSVNLTITGLAGSGIRKLVA